MTSASDFERLNAFVDGELGLEEQLQLEARLREDAAMRTQVERLRALREAVRDRTDYHAAPDALRTRIAAAIGSPAPAPAPRVRSTWFDWKPWSAAMAAAMVAVVAFNVAVLPAREEQRIEGDVVASHVRATLGQRAVDVASSDHHTVKPWLSSRLDFSPPVHEMSQPGAALLGGRVDYVDGRPVAALAYRYAGHAVDDFIWPTTRGDRPVAMATTRGFNVAHWTRAGMTHWLISDLNAAELAQLAADLGRDAP
jgi:anti-sigma factor RsiW